MRVSNTDTSDRASTIKDAADVVVALNPFGIASARLTVAATQAGGLGVLDLTAGGRRAREELALATEWSSAGFGVRLADAEVADLPPQVHTVLLTADSSCSSADFPGRRILIEVTERAEARQAVERGAHGLIARGSEVGGHAGELSTFVFLQSLLADDSFDLPIWAMGGIGEHTAAAAIGGGAEGVVLDTQLALLPEADLPAEYTMAINGLDGSETTVVDGRRVLLRKGPDSDQHTIEIGQDAFLPARFRDQWETVASVVRGIRAGVVSALETAEPDIGPESRGSEALGTTYAIAQGPMTRVSDQPAFAGEVARGGALPFIALALSGAAQTRAVLEETKELLGTRPWGVGVLGFAADEVKNAQLEVIREVRPSHAIIAGGRPAQAEAMEELGISTFLHVPSPGLLGQFLEAGARKFIFEGSECGGHVGPRTSFSLWEAQLGVLRDFLATAPATAASQLQIFFAGGVHDERSAAMVAAMAAPLAERGVGVGVLMGTAYLFTSEAVDAGAVLPGFQQQVLDADRTDLLETAPGHATRCVHSPFTGEYAAIKQDLHERAVPSRAAWEQLEQLNVGRLRLASKGIERVGDELRNVDEQRQVAEGMFMAGDVAVLRHDTTTIATLHESVTAGARAFFVERRRQTGIATDEPPAESGPLDIAIVGMSAMFPGAPDLETYWANVLSGVDAVTEVPGQRWDSSIYYDPDGAGVATPSRWGGFLPEIPFDPLAYGIPPESLSSIEPVQLLALEAAQRALNDAGYGTRTFDRDRASVVFGAEAGSDLSNAMALRTVLPSYLSEIPPELDEQLPRLTEDSFPGVLANVIAGRIANRLDLGGANYTVDAACASSLTAVDVACKELVTGTSDLVLCGGADLHNGINDYLLFASVHALSPTGRSATFDRTADGIALGEGVACVALKRLADAERDGDRIYGVIAGVGSSSDGRGLGLTAPRPEGQRRAVERAYLMAGVSPSSVGIVEAHGTGTVVGDRTELGTLTSVFTEAGATPGSCAISSVKSQIGHTKCAAGLAGLIKTTLALYSGVKPPTLHLSDPNPGWDSATSPFVFHTQARPWAAAPAERIAGISAFGFGGTNFHVVLRAHAEGPPPVHAADEWPVELFTFRGGDHAAAVKAAKELLSLVETEPDKLVPPRLRDLALSAANRSERAATRGHRTWIALVVSSVDELAATLRRAIDGEHAPRDGIFLADETETGAVAMLFPGQGSQRPGMFAELFVAFPELQRYLRLDEETTRTLFPPDVFDEVSGAEQRDRLTDTRRAQPALGLTGLAAHHLLAKAGLRPAMAAGHSYGELVALAAADVLGPESLIRCSNARAEAILDAAGEDDPGAMAAVSAAPSAVDTALVEAGLHDSVVTANRNSPKQAVISGRTGDVDAAIERLRAQGLGAKRIQVACAFHSPVVAEGGERFAKELEDFPLRRPDLPVWSNRTAAEYPNDPAAIRAELAAQIGSPVAFTEQIEAMYEAGARVFVEAGPGATLSKLVSATLGQRPHRTITLESSKRTGLAGFLAAMAELAVSGTDVRTGWLFRGRDAVDAARTARRRRPGWTVDGHLIRTADGSIPTSALHPAQRISEAFVTSGHHTGSGAPANPEELIADFLNTSRKMVEAQRDVLLSYLGTDPGTRPAAPAPTRTQELTESVALVEQPVSTAPSKAESADPPAVHDEDSVLSVVLEVIGDRTGYPADMIEPDLDLEADLSVDSIKRAEIGGELATRLSLPETGDVEELAKARTAAGITSLIVGEAGKAAEPAVGAVAAGDEVEAVPIAPKRLLMKEFELAPAVVTSAELAGCTVLVLGGGPVAEAVAAVLAERGANPVTSSEVPSEPAFDGVIHLPNTQDRSDESVLPGVFPTYQALLDGSPRWLLVSGPVDGLRGFFRSMSREYPDMIARVVEHPADEPPESLAHALVDEMSTVDREPVVLREGAQRRGIRMDEQPPGALANTGAGPAADGAAEATAIGLDRDSVILLVGGAKGITARFATALASASRCRIEIFGRTPHPVDEEDPAIAAAVTESELRAALIAAGSRTPAEIERSVRSIQGDREVRDTLRRLSGLGSEVRYHSVDMVNSAAVHQAIKDVHAEHGRLDGVVYAAGVIEDKLIAEKQPESFSRVFSTKVDGVHTLFEAIEQCELDPRFAVLFGSIAATLGNRGQSDYAAANDALERFGARWASQGEARRGVTVHWGPWAPTGTNNGMVTPELMRSYANRGIELIDPEEGTMSLLRELAWGADETTAVVYTASGW